MILLKGRPKKIRKVKNVPGIRQFSPRGKPGRPDEVVLGIDQLEAIRIADLEGQYHHLGASSMGISRSSFGRILKTARKTIATALVNGKIIRIEGGIYEQSNEIKSRSSEDSK